MVKVGLENDTLKQPKCPSNWEYNTGQRQLLDIQSGEQMDRVSFSARRNKDWFRTNPYSFMCSRDSHERPRNLGSAAKPAIYFSIRQNTAKQMRYSLYRRTILFFQILKMASKQYNRPNQTGFFDILTNPLRGIKQSGNSSHFPRSSGDIFVSGYSVKSISHPNIRPFIGSSSGIEPPKHPRTFIFHDNQLRMETLYLFLRNCEMLGNE